MNKLMSIFGAIIFASFIMTSCGGGSAEASGESTGDAVVAASGDAAPAGDVVVAASEEAAPTAVATDAKASEEVKGKK